MYNQTGCLRGVCFLRGNILKGKIIILMGMMLRFSAEPSLSSPADKQALKQSALETPLDCRGNLLYIADRFLDSRTWNP